MKQYPFPDRETAYEEIKRDVMYKKLAASGADIEAIVERAWETGASAAKELFAEVNGETDFFRILRQKGLPVKHVDKDYVIAGRRYFSEYSTGKKEMVLYTVSIRKWADKNEMTMEEAENMILSHEFFHHLENTTLGLTSRQYTLPALTVFGHDFGANGIRALSEVGAHGFARTYYELANKPLPTK